jgi:predicted secreted protein
MTLVTGLAIYFVIWWIVLFAVLPWGSRPPERPEPGMADSAPENPRLLLKFFATTIVSGVIFLAFWGFMSLGGHTFRELFGGR